MAHSKSLAEMFPDIASQWDYNRNGSVTPETISAGHIKKHIDMSNMPSIIYKKNL